MTSLATRVGEQVRARRGALGLSQARLAEAAGISTELVSRIERGRCLPSVTTLVALSRNLGCTPNDLLSFSGRAPPELRALTTLMQSLPPRRRREVLRAAEALALYGRDRDRSR